MSAVTAGAQMEIVLLKSQNPSLCKLERTSGFLRELSYNVPMDLGSLAQFCLALQNPQHASAALVSPFSHFVLVHMQKGQRHSMASPWE